MRCSMFLLLVREEKRMNNRRCSEVRASEVETESKEKKRKSTCQSHHVLGFFPGDVYERDNRNF